MTNEEILSCIQTLRFLENNFINDHGMFMNDKHPDNIEKIIGFLIEKRWIPVSERLPDNPGNDYLVTIEYKGEIEGVDVATYATGGYLDGLWDTPNDWIEGPSELWHVTAWTPLPRPYEKARRIKNDNS